MLAAGVVVAVGVAGVVTFMGAGSGSDVALVAERDEHSHATPVEERAEPVEPTPVEPELPTPAEPPTPVEDLPTVEEPPPSTEAATLKFGARVVSARGKPLGKGAKCTINVHVTGAHIDSLDASCGDTLLYDSRTPLNGMSSFGSDLLERQKGDGWVYRVLYSDTGMRSSRSQFRLNSGSKQATAFSESSDPFSVELEVNELSELRQGASLLNTPLGTAALTLGLRKVSEEGTAPAVSGACKLASEFVEGSENGPRCKTELRCGSAILYGKGTQGFSTCQVRAEAIAFVEDPKETHEDGDPWLRVDVEGGKVELRDSPSQQAYTLVFEVEQ